MDDRQLMHMLSGGGPTMGRLLEAAAEHRVQMLLTMLPVRGQPGEQRSAAFRADAEYVYPASTIKLVTAVGAVGRLWHWRRERARPDLTLSTPVRIGDGPVTTVAGELRRVFLVSDNPAHNLLHDLVGHREIHEMMWAAGLASVRVRHRLSVVELAERARRSPGVCFACPEPLDMPERFSDLNLPPEHGAGLDVGCSHVDAQGVRHERPMSFAEKNRISLRDLHALTMATFAPDVRGGIAFPWLVEADRRELEGVAALCPAESGDAAYPRASYPDEYNKFLLPGLIRVRPRAEWRYVNKIGRAYGFTLDTAVIEHVPSGARCVLSAAVYTNRSGELNTDRYDYLADADPFMAELGACVARELLS